MLGFVHCYPFNCTTSIISTGVHDTLPNHVVWIQAVLNLQTPDQRKPKIKRAATAPGLSPSNTTRGLADTPRETQLLWKKKKKFFSREEGWKQDQLGKAHKAGAYRRCSSVNTWWTNEWISMVHSCSLSLITLPLCNYNNQWHASFLGSWFTELELTQGTDTQKQTAATNRRSAWQFTGQSPSRDQP